MAMPLRIRYAIDFRLVAPQVLHPYLSLLPKSADLLLLDYWITRCSLRYVAYLPNLTKHHSRRVGSPGRVNFVEPDYAPAANSAPLFRLSSCRGSKPKMTTITPVNLFD